MVLEGRCPIPCRSVGSVRFSRCRGRHDHGEHHVAGRCLLTAVFRRETLVLFCPFTRAHVCQLCACHLLWVLLQRVHAVNHAVSRLGLVEALCGAIVEIGRKLLMQLLRLSSRFHLAFTAIVGFRCQLYSLTRAVLIRAGYTVLLWCHVPLAPTASLLPMLSRCLPGLIACWRK